MKENIGKTIRELRLRKGLTGKELCEACSRVLTPQQLSNVENGLQCPSSEKLILILKALNINYDEFSYLMNDGILNQKRLLEEELQLIDLNKDKNELEVFIKKTTDLVHERQDVFFRHILWRAQAMHAILIQGEEFAEIRKYMVPIEVYLNEIEEFSSYEIFLTKCCIPYMNIDKSVLFAKKSLATIAKHAEFYKDSGEKPSLLLQIATACLEFERYIDLASDYAKKCMLFLEQSPELDITQQLSAKIIYQIARYKLGDGTFESEAFLSALNIFKLIGLDDKHKQFLELAHRHNIQTKFRYSKMTLF